MTKNGKAGKADEVHVTGVIEKLHYASPGFSAGKIKPATGPVVSFAGPVYFELESYVTLFGAWHDDPKWGKQLKAARFEFASGTSSQLDEAGLAHYLAVSKDFPGIGPAKARRLAARFGADFGRVLEETPEAVAEAAPLALEVVLEIREAWRSNSERNATATWLAGFGLTAHQINSILSAFGNGTRRILTEDPYRMIDVIDGFGFVRTDEIALKTGLGKEHVSRLRAGLIHAAKQELEAGHTWTARDALLRSANELLCLDGLDGLSRVEAELDELLGGALHVAGFPSLAEDDAGRIALGSIRSMELEIAGWLAEAAARRNPLPGLHDGPDLRLGDNAEQQAALRLCMSRQLAIVTGGAGTGKTFLLGSVVRRYLDAGHTLIGLCAPTGKAARRVTDSLAALGIDRDAATIHRLLGFRGGEGNAAVWGYNRRNRMMADVVICDEASMLDVPLAHRLFQAIDWTRTAVVLVGDPNQLPPIGPGNVLRDCIARAPALGSLAALTRCVRQAGTLKRNSSAILDGVVVDPETPPGTRDAAWYVLDHGTLTDSAACADYVVNLVDKHVEKLAPPELAGRQLDLMRDVQVLTPTHKGPLGTAALNIRLQAVLQAKLFGVTVEPVPDGKRPPFLAGDRIIQTKNDYTLGVMNGTLGWIRSVDERGSLLVEFDGVALPISLPKSARHNLAHAYALTVHKYQGSEVPVAVCIVHKSHSFQQHRAMIYTAVTRARSVAVLVGDAWGIRNAAKKSVVESRRTWLALAGGAGASAEHLVSPVTFPPVAAGSPSW